MRRSFIILATLITAGCKDNPRPDGRSPAPPAGETPSGQKEAPKIGRADPSDPGRKEPLLDRVADRLASHQMLEATLGKQLLDIDLEHLTGQPLAFEEKMAWGVFDACMELPTADNVEASVRLLRVSNEATTAEDVRAIVSHRASLVGVRTPEQHRATVDYSIRRCEALSRDKAAGVAKALVMVKASTTNDVAESTKHVRGLFVKVLTDTPDFLKAFAKVEDESAAYKAEERRIAGEALKAKFTEARKGM